MALYCKFVGHTYTFCTENQKVSWNTGKDLKQLHITSEGEPATWLECRRCGERIEEPTSEQVKLANCNVRQP